MKQTIKQTIGKLLTAVAFAAILGGTVFALPFRPEADKNFEKSAKKLWTKSFVKVEKMALKNKGGMVEAINQGNFLLGHYMVRTSYDAYFEDFEGVAGDLEFLIEAFQGQPEAFELENLLKSVTDGTANAEEIYAAMKSVEGSYRDQLSDEQKWFFDYGEWTTCLIGDTVIKEDEYIFEDLDALQRMAEDAPPEVAKEILEPVTLLAEYSEQDSFTDEDYEELRSGAFNIFDLVFGEE